MLVKPNHSRSHIHSCCYPSVTNPPSHWSSHTPTCLHYFFHLSVHCPLFWMAHPRYLQLPSLLIHLQLCSYTFLPLIHMYSVFLLQTFIPLLFRAHIHLLPALTVSPANISSWRLCLTPSVNLLTTIANKKRLRVNPWCNCTLTLNPSGTRTENLTTLSICSTTPDKVSSRSKHSSKCSWYEEDTVENSRETWKSGETMEIRSEDPKSNQISLYESANTT